MATYRCTGRGEGTHAGPCSGEMTEREAFDHFEVLGHDCERIQVIHESNCGYCLMETQEIVPLSECTKHGKVIK